MASRRTRLKRWRDAQIINANALSVTISIMSLEDIKNERLAKLVHLRELDINPYPIHTKRTYEGVSFLKDHVELEKSRESVTLAGRVMSIRGHGGSMFVDIFDGDERVQSYLQKDVVGDEEFKLFSETVDMGDFIECSGTAFTTKRGMASLSVKTWKMLTKSILPIPDEWFGIKDEEERYRKRYLDILLSKDLADRFRRRSMFWNTIRSYLLDKNFIEVETPVLETTTGGADARPFSTHHNALDIDLYLRISVGELWQKRLLVAGFPKVFEIGRVFRNEGMSSEHAQDYTAVEFYEAFSDYEKGMEMIIELYKKIADEVYSTRVFTIREHSVNFDDTWERYDFCEILRDKFNIDPLDTSVDAVRDALRSHDVSFDDKHLSLVRGVDTLWKSVRKTLAGPGFLVGVPTYLEPLAKRNEDDARIVQRFQVIIAGSEVGKGFSELNDPLDQAERFQTQQALRDAGDSEAQMNDASYVEALEYGMPPAFGFGVSERLFSFLENVSVREGQLFPLLRPQK